MRHLCEAAVWGSSGKSACRIDCPSNGPNYCPIGCFVHCSIDCTCVGQLHETSCKFGFQAAVSREAAPVSRLRADAIKVYSTSSPAKRPFRARHPASLGSMHLIQGLEQVSLGLFVKKNLT